MEKFKTNKLFCIIICIVAIIICVVIYSTTNNYDEEYIIENEISELNTNVVTENSIDEKFDYIYIHIIGEVNDPGVVEVKQGARIKDVIEKAGGITNMADLDRVNLAYEVSDGQKINIPNKLDDKNEIVEDNYIVDNYNTNVVIDGGNTKSDKVNINTATQSELETVTRNWTFNCFENY